MPFSADDGPISGQAVTYQYDTDSETVSIRLKTPDTVAPETRGDWSWTEDERDGYEAFHELCSHGDISASEFQPSRRKTGDAYYELAFAVNVEHAEETDDPDRALALDAGMRKDMTAVVVTDDGEQVSTPQFIRFTDHEKMRRLHRERTRLNDRLSALRRDGRSHTDEFSHVQSEYERVNTKIRHKREQLTHDIANQVLALALAFDVDAIVHEDLRSLSPPRDEGRLSWEVSSWARREIIENIAYRAACAGVAVERAYPQGTSRSFPRCGATGHTCKSPDHQQEHWWGGHFRCDNSRCGFEGDRDYIVALNVARVFFSDGNTLDHGFTSSYTGDAEIVLAGRSAGERSRASQSSSAFDADRGTRLTFGAGIVAYEPEQAGATAGGGSAVIGPAVALSESNADGSDGRGPAVQQCTQFLRCTTESY